LNTSSLIGYSRLFSSTCFPPLLPFYHNLSSFPILSLQCLVTPEVAKEFGEPLPDWIYITAVENTEKTQELFTKLDLGESSSIALALETKNALVILDERKAHNIARSLGLNITGTVGILLEAYRQGFISDFYSAISGLRQINLHIPHDSEIEKLSKTPR
jgi:predicted nucleic acid-binding protein